MSHIFDGTVFLNKLPLHCVVIFSLLHQLPTNEPPERKKKSVRQADSMSKQSSTHRCPFPLLTRTRLNAPIGSRLVRRSFAIEKGIRQFPAACKVEERSSSRKENDLATSGAPDTTHRLEADMMNVETALWDVHPARALGQRGVGTVQRWGDRGEGREREGLFVTVTLT